MTLDLKALNQASTEQFTSMLEGIYEHSPWIARAAASRRPFVSRAALERALVDAVDAAGRDAQLALLRAHPELAGNAMVADGLTAESASEQARAGLRACTPEQFARLQQLNAEYNARFGFPFILAVRGPRGAGLGRESIIAAFERRLPNHPDFEFAECLRNVHRIAQLRLADALGDVPATGNLVWDWAEALASHSDPGYREHGQLTVTYLTAAHRACAAEIAGRMRDQCGFDDVHVDAVGNVVGIYHASAPDAQRLLTGSHYDTVRNAGKLDGRLGVLAPMACVRSLHRGGRRLPFAIEVVAFAEEEGQRYKATFLGSGALTGTFNPAWLDQTDADGVTMRSAMAATGLDPNGIASLARDPSRYIGFVEVHIEQGPVLNAKGLPLGVVTSINGGVRYVGEIVGRASHAGTTPMGQRQDAAAAAAELVLYVEKRCAQAPDLVGTVGMLAVPNGSINVIPGSCRFSLDIRATTDPVRDAAIADVLRELDALCARRGVAVSIEETMRQPAAPSDPGLQARWERAVGSLGLPVHRMPSGAGHDAMKLAEIMPQAMLFVRGENAGISHNPLESSTSDDIELAVAAMQSLLDELAVAVR